METQRRRGLILIAFLILWLQHSAQDRHFELSTTVGVQYYYSPYSFGTGTNISLTPGINIDNKTFVGAGVDLISPYYGQEYYRGFYLEGRKMIYKQNHSCLFAFRYGFNKYINPAVGVIQHFDRVDLQFMFSYKYHLHRSLEWVQGFEMRAGIIFKGKRK